MTRRSLSVRDVDFSSGAIEVAIDCYAVPERFLPFGAKTNQTGVTGGRNLAVVAVRPAFPAAAGTTTLAMSVG